MKNAKILLSSLISTALLFTGCMSGSGQEEGDQTQGAERTSTPKKEVTVFDLGKDQAIITLTKSGTTASDIVSSVSPELSGKISELEVEIGDTVKKGDLIATLGDSLSTDQQKLDLESSNISLELQKSSNSVTKNLSQTSITTSELAADVAYNNYTNAISNRDLTYNSFQSSLVDAEIAFNNAKNSYFTAQDTYELSEEQLEGLEEQLEELKDTDGTKEAQTQLENSILSAEIQLQSLELNLETAQNSYIQAENAIFNLKNNNKQTLDSLNLQVANAKNQYESALNSVQSSKLQADLQNIGADSQLLQADTKLKSAEINDSYLSILAPIEGIITQIMVEETDSVSPGQVIVEIENPNNNIAKTSVTPEEALLVAKTESIKIISDYGTAEGEIKTFAPIANSLTKKIDVEISIDGEKIPSEEFVEIEFTIDTDDDIYIPLNSVNQSVEGFLVQVVGSDDKVQLKDVEIGEIIGNYIQIKSGLTGKEKVINAGTNFLTEGESVIINQ